MPTPTYVIGHPEAMLVAVHLEERHGVRVAGSFDPLGPVWTPGSPVDRPLPAEPFVVLNGSGNFHHETLPLLEKVLRGMEGELAYVQIDAHPDTRPMFRWFVDCTSFVGRVLENKRVRSVHLLGQFPECITDPGQKGPIADRLTYFRCDYFAKFHQYVAGQNPRTERYSPSYPEIEASARRNPAIRRLRKTRTKSPEGELVDGLLVDWLGLEAFDAETLPDLPVYLTVDLDVAKDRPVTDWRRKAQKGDGKLTPNQGEIPFAEMIALIEAIGRKRRIIGADVCGLIERTTWLSDPILEDSLEAVAETHAALVRAIESRGQGAPAPVARSPS
ncbi:MAG: hypothetical protein HYV07_26200 [Deltaproteobacteria bacterium]|nr:hypothetical protein [Deltaproteobacteria bacterium]